MSIRNSLPSSPQGGTPYLLQRPAPQTSGLVNLPPEVFLKILGKLSIQQFGVLNQTCRHFCFITTTHPLTFLLSEYFPNFQKTDLNQTDLEALKEQHHINSNVAKGVYASHIFEAHDETVTSICLDGQRLISSSGDGKIKIWDLNTNTCTATLQGHESGVCCLAQDKQRLFSGLHDGTIKIWDLNTNTCTATLERHDFLVSCLVLDGQRLYSGSLDGTIKIWDLNTNTCTATLPGQPGGARIANNGCIPITVLALGAKKLFSGSHDKSIKIWDLNTNTCTATLEGHNRGVFRLALDGQRLFSGSDDGTIKIWDLNTNTCTATLEVNKGSARILALGKQRLFSGADAGAIQIWDLNTNTCTTTVQGHKGYNESLALDESRLFSGSFFGTIKIWNFSAPHEAVFKEIADLLISDDSSNAEDAMDRFGRMPTEAKKAIYGELYSIMASFANDYPGCAEDAFHNQNGQSSTPEQRAQAILNYLAKRS